MKNYDFSIIFGFVIWSCYLVLVKVIFLGLGFGHVFSLAFGETWMSPQAWRVDVLLSMIGLVIFGSIVAFTAFNYLLLKVSPEKVATSAYVNPIVALFLGWLVLNEKLSLQSIIAAGVLLTGVYFITSKK